MWKHLASRLPVSHGSEINGTLFLEIFKMKLILEVPTDSLSDKLKQYFQSKDYQDMVKDFIDTVLENVQDDRAAMSENKEKKVGQRKETKSFFFEKALVNNTSFSVTSTKNNTSTSINTSYYNKAETCPIEQPLNILKHRKDRTNNIPHKSNSSPRRKYKLQLSGDPIVDKFLLTWDEFNLSPHIRKGKSFDNTVWKIGAIRSGELFSNGALVPEKFKGKQFNYSQFYIAVERFAKAAHNKDYYPFGKKYLQQMNLGEFLYNHFNTSVENRSYFLYYLENQPRLISLAKEKNKELTDALMESYIRHISSGHSKDYLVQQFLSQFRTASNHLHDYLESVKSYLHPMMINSMKDKADILVKAALKIFPDPKRITPHTLSSNFLIERIPAYMQNQGFFLANSSQFSIYDYKGNGGHANSEKEKGGNGTGTTDRNGHGSQYKVPSGNSPNI
jgi:hypothetical protein